LIHLPSKKYLCRAKKKRGDKPRRKGKKKYLVAFLRDRNAIENGLRGNKEEQGKKGRKPRPAVALRASGGQVEDFNPCVKGTVRSQSPV